MVLLTYYIDTCYVANGSLPISFVIYNCHLVSLSVLI